MNSNFSAVWFDLDGTLLDSAQDFHTCLNYLLAEHDRPALSLDSVQKKFSEGALALVQLAFPEVQSSSSLEKLRQQFLEIYQHFLKTNIAHFFPGTLAVLQQMVEAKIPIGIITNKHEYLARPLLKHAGILKDMSVLICGDSPYGRKPSGEPLVKACEQLNVLAKDCCYVGDSLVDMQAAQAAQMPGLLAMWGYWPILQYAIEDWPYTRLVYRPEEILKIS